MSVVFSESFEIIVYRIQDSMIWWFGEIELPFFFTRRGIARKLSDIGLQKRQKSRTWIKLNPWNRSLLFRCVFGLAIASSKPFNSLISVVRFSGNGNNAGIKLLLHQESIFLTIGDQTVSGQTFCRFVICLISLIGIYLIDVLKWSRKPAQRKKPCNFWRC